MLRGKTALITGSVAGLGYAMAEALAEQQANIILHGLEPLEQVQQASERLQSKHGVPVIYSQANLTVVSEIETLIEYAQRTFGGVDILINNAVIRNFAAIDTLKTESWNESIAVNLSAAFHTSRLTIPQMKKRMWGRIINISSVYGTTATANRVSYITTKTALIGLTKSTAMDVATEGITCNALCPGTVPTPPIVERIAGNAAKAGITIEEAEHAYISSRHPTGRFVAMKSVASFAVFLCSEAGKDITGAVLPVDGGWTIE
ncbi:FabG Dehydrogenases with different specificities (related to short-chain alcohol dehydrogenases) [Burkholderiaceae bacterium]